MASRKPVVVSLVSSLLVLLIGSRVSRQETVAKPENILTPEGEVKIDHKTGQPLPESMNDGELEGGDHHIGWTYKDQTKWANEYPLCKGVKLRQSPIDICTESLIERPDLKLEFVDYDQEVEFQLKNTHHSVSLTPIPHLSTPSIKLNWLGDEKFFELQEIHFHWGDSTNKGSEHEINNQRAAAEMHMVHYLKGINKADIGNVESSVLVVGVLIETDSEDHNKLESLVQNTANINGTDTECMSDNPENLINLLPDHRQSFYAYNGSLTTPPCYEVVTWIVMSEPVYISNDKLLELSNMEAPDSVKGKYKIASNHRDIQPLLDRPVYVSFNIANSVSSEFNQNALKDDKFNSLLKNCWDKVKGIKNLLKNFLTAL